MEKIFLNCIKTKQVDHYVGNITDQALYDHYLKKLIKPKEKILLVPKGHFHFSKFANIRPSPITQELSQRIKKSLNFHHRFFFLTDS